jgi:hypothetical protein
MALAVIASANESNHENLVSSKFYNEWKTKINKSKKAADDVELFGLVNIALNKKVMHLVFKDLKTIHRLADKSGKIDFKIRVDMCIEASKFIAMTLRSKKTGEGDNAMVDECLRALVYTLNKLTTKLDQQNFMILKYFLAAILECTKNLQQNLQHLASPELLAFLRHVLQDHFEFQNKRFNDQLLHFSLQAIVCEIFLHLKSASGLFDQEETAQSVKALVTFARRAIEVNIDTKTQLVSNTLRVLCQMISSVRQHPEVL